MARLRFGRFRFGALEIDGATYEYDVVIDRGRVRKRRKKLSKPFRGAFGHTPLSVAEDLPWDCQRLVIGTGAYGALPIMPEVEREAHARHVRLVACPTPEAIANIAKGGKGTNAVLHVTC
jgi:hypothetical protein